VHAIYVNRSKVSRTSTPRIARAAEFLLAQQAADGTFHDFRTLAGEAAAWTTAYVAYHLGSADGSNRCLRAAERSLWAHQHLDGGWGYNAWVPSDGDSTAWALLFLARRARRRRALARAVARLLAHQHRGTGGFRTYVHHSAILRYMRLPLTISAAGWTQPHVEVTAVAGRALAALEGASPAALRAAWRFVRERQTDDGRWRSYWWTTPLYATCQAVAFARAQPTVQGAASAVRRAIRWTIETQRADGGWGPPRASSPRAFDTALGMMILSRGEPGHAVRAALLRARDCLRGMQLQSGRWPVEAILRIPPPSSVRPDNYRAWRRDELGTGVVVPDHHAAFTTATAIAALASAHRALAGRR